MSFKKPMTLSRAQIAAESCIGRIKKKMSLDIRANHICLSAMSFYDNLIFMFKIFPGSIGKRF